MSGCILKISDLMLKLRWPRPTPALPEPVLHMEENAFGSFDPFQQSQGVRHSIRGIP